LRFAILLFFALIEKDWLFCFGYFMAFGLSNQLMIFSLFVYLFVWGYCFY